MTGTCDTILDTGRVDDGEPAEDPQSVRAGSAALR